MKRLLLTGATGFVGRHAVAPLLQRGFDIHALSRSATPSERSPGVEWHTVDLLDSDATRAVVSEIGASHLLHFAWYTEHGLYWEAPENLEFVAASLGLLRGFRECGGERAVLAGTCAEYDWSGDCCGEGTALAPSTLYGVSKNALRQVFEAYCRASGLGGAWGRIFFTFGAGEQPARVVASAARALLAGESAAFSSGAQIRDFLYVEDLADAFAALVDSSITGSLDIGSGEDIALRDLLTQLERLAGHDGLLRFGELPDRDEPARIVADVRRLHDELDWHPPHGLSDGLRRTLDSWRDRVAEPA